MRVAVDPQRDALGAHHLAEIARKGARDTLTVHLSSRRWLAERLAQPHDGATVIVTHHAPLIRTRPPDPRLRAVAGACLSLIHI